MVEEIVAGRKAINQPAGHVEPGESIIDAVIRETREESGFAFEPAALVGVYTWSSSDDGRSYLRFCISGSATPPGGPVRLDQGIIAAGWFSRAELVARSAELRSPLVMQAIRAFDAGCHFPLDSISHIGSTSTAADVIALA